MADRIGLFIILPLMLTGLLLTNPSAAECCDGHCRVVGKAGIAFISFSDTYISEISDFNYHKEKPLPLTPPPCRCLPDPSWSERVNYNYLRSNLNQTAESPVSGQYRSTSGFSGEPSFEAAVGAIPLFLLKSSLAI